MSVKLFQFHTHGVMISFLFSTPYPSCQKSSTGADSCCTSAGKGCTTPAWGREVTAGVSRCSRAASSPSVSVHHIPLTPVQGKQEHLHPIQIIWAPGTLPAHSGAPVLLSACPERLPQARNFPVLTAAHDADPLMLTCTLSQASLGGDGHLTHHSPSTVPQETHFCFKASPNPAQWLRTEQSKQTEERNAIA